MNLFVKFDEKSGCFCYSIKFPYGVTNFGCGADARDKAYALLEFILQVEWHRRNYTLNKMQTDLLSIIENIENLAASEQFGGLEVEFFIDFKDSRIHVYLDGQLVFVAEWDSNFLEILQQNNIIIPPTA